MFQTNVKPQGVVSIHDINHEKIVHLVLYTNRIKQLSYMSSHIISVYDYRGVCLEY